MPVLGFAINGALPRYQEAPFMSRLTGVMIVPMAPMHGHWFAVQLAAATAPLALILWFLSEMALTGNWL